MIKLPYTTRAFVKPNGQVAVRVRWDQRNKEVTFITGCYADKNKWDATLHRARRNTTHIVKGKEFTAFEINRRIEEFEEQIEQAFLLFQANNIVPSTVDFKDSVNDNLGRKAGTNFEKKPENIDELFENFIIETGRERTWAEGHDQYFRNPFSHLKKAVPKITPYNITKKTMLAAKDWYLKEGYKNRTIHKNLVNIKLFFTWLRSQGFPIPEDVVNFRTNLTIVRHTPTPMTYDELMTFYNFDFSTYPEADKLAYVRDQWCFMAFTSLRISDLSRLRPEHIQNGIIRMEAQKTKEKLYIPLTDEAKAILERNKDQTTYDGYCFKVFSDSYFVKSLRKVVKLAGIDRMVTVSDMYGTELRERTIPLCDKINPHDARRTFVSCSLLTKKMLPENVMACTGHKDYRTMRPYIAVNPNGVTRDMQKWNHVSRQDELIGLLQNASPEQIDQILAFTKNTMGIDDEAV